MPVEVQSDANGVPTAIRLGHRLWLLARVEDRWVVEDEWWRDSPIVRIYYETTLEDGRRITVFRDRLSGRWYRQHV